MRYFYLIPAERFHGRLAPALAGCAAARSFAPALELSREFANVAGPFAQRDAIGMESVLSQITQGLPFRRDLWRILVGELLLFTSVRLPELETPLESLAALLRQPLAENRALFSPIQHAILGARDLHFGGAFYRPDFAGWNDLDDLSRLNAWLGGVSPASWSAASVPMPAAEERDDELAFAREWFPELVAIYRDAEQSRLVVAIESV
jgi:hypothetical protein